MKYYRITYSKYSKRYGVAYTSSDVSTHLLPHCGIRIESWDPLTLELRDGEFSDYPSSNLGARLCSEKFRNIIIDCKSKNDQLQWLEVNVQGISGEIRKYYILHFPEDYPVINKEKSIMAGDFVVKPVFNESIIQNYQLLTVPGSTGRRFVVSEYLKKLIIKNKLTNISFSKVPTERT